MVSENTSKNQSGFFMGWRDLVITPLVWAVTILGALYCTFLIADRFPMTFMTKVAVFYVSLVVTTLVTLTVIRRVVPIRQGVISRQRNPLQFYVWSLYGFLCITNLSLQYMNGLIPPPFRKLFYQLLGAKMGRGIISIGGRMSEPFLVTIEEGAMIGDDALLIPHVVTKSRGDDLLVLRPIKIERGAVVGAKSILMPGVMVGAGAMVNAMSVVPMSTKIKPGEVWGGNPAVKLSDLNPQRPELVEA